MISFAWPEVGPDDSHSLTAIAVRSADGRSNVQAGWSVDPERYGDNEPRLFAVYRSGGTDACYGCGFVPSSGVTAPLGEVPISAIFAIQYHGGNWWVGHGNEWLGYFPGSLWSGGFTRTAWVHAFAEVASRNGPPCSAMGKGGRPDQANAAGISSITPIGATRVPLVYDEPEPPYEAARRSDTSFWYGGPYTC